MLAKIKNYIYNNTQLGKARYLNYLYRYDLQQFFKNSCMGSNKKADNLATEIRLLVHAIEKGLSLPNPKPGFGKEKIIQLLQLNREYSNLDSVNDQQIDDLVKSTVSAYCAFQKKLEVDVSFIPLEYREFNCSSMRAGIANFDVKEKTNFDKIAKNRHSSRGFSSKPISEEIIKQVIELAQTAPSACNRQPVRVYACTNSAKIDEILKMHGGLRGFDKPSVVFAITGDLNLYTTEYERNTVFVDGGIFVMNLLYSLDAFGLLSCPIIWGCEPSNDIKLSKLLNINDSHKIVSLVVAGYGKERTYTASLSPRRKTDDILNIIT